MLYGHKHRCFKGRLTGISYPFNKAIVVASLLRPVTSPDTAFALDYSTLCAFLPVLIQSEGGLYYSTLCVFLPVLIQSESGFLYISHVTILSLVTPGVLVTVLLL